MISPLLRLDGLNYMKRYFDMYNDQQRQCKQFDCDQISKQFRLSWIGQHHHEKCSICQVVSFIELILLICIIHPIVQMFQDDSNTFNNYLTANLFAITPVGRRILVLFIIMFVIQIQYYLHRLYYRNQSVSILNAVLFQQDRQQFHPPYRYRTRMAGKVVKDIAMMMIKMVNLFMIITILIIISMELLLLKFILENLDYFFAIFNRPIFVSLNHAILKRFQHFNTYNLKLIQWGNVYCEAVTVFIFVNIPINCYIVLYILSGCSNWFYSFILSIIACQQILCIFGVHLMFAICNNNFQESSTRFLNLLARESCRQSRVKNLSLLLKISNYGHAYHTENKYGFTYGKLQLISMREFLMVND
ncbi:hypothetical protein HUG17_9277 [Dermatophagoides farinae]|uniref:Uncharacterized protein n=1 Tax=Dermatophagoides farinae TaxID=6954 RepID=A0A9D4NUH2_DERFA|nr:hypothetical protein HUG17_9277 [Dermatophagoides farinae]